MNVWKIEGVYAVARLCECVKIGKRSLLFMNFYVCIIYCVLSILIYYLDNENEIGLIMFRVF